MKKTLDMELDVNEVLNFKPHPPRKRFWDYLPTFIIGPMRKLTGRPGATPYEKWIVGLCLVKIMLENMQTTEPVKPTSVPDKEKDGKVDPWRWS